MTAGRAFGIALVVLAIVGAVLYTVWPTGNTPVVVVPAAAPSPTPNPHMGLTVVANGSTVNLLRDPEFLKIVADQEQTQQTLNRPVSLTVDVIPRGTISMVDMATNDEKQDLWPGGDMALTRFRFNYNDKSGQYDAATGKNFEAYYDNTFSSPLVILMRKKEAEAFIKAGYAQREGNTLTVNAHKLFADMRKRKTWNSIGVTDRSGPITIGVTDPATDEVGATWMGLVAGYLLEDRPYDDPNIRAIWPELTTIVDKRAGLPVNSEVLFERFLLEGWGAAVVSENQWAEFLIANKDARDTILSDIELGNLTPTASQRLPFIARSQAGTYLARMFKNPNVRKVALERHMLRSTLGSLIPDELVKFTGISATTRDVVQLPNAHAMNTMVDFWQGKR